MDTPTPVPRGRTAKKIEYGRYTGQGSSALQRYYQAVDAQYRPRAGLLRRSG